MVMWTDICVNLTNKQFEQDAADVIDSAIQAGVRRMIIVGTDVEHSLQALRWAEKYPEFLRCTAGCHPHDAKTMNDTAWSELESLLASPLVVAVGECGLDFNRNYSDPEVQVDVFIQQLQLATKYSLPVYLHERDAHEQMIGILHQYRGRITNKVIHCFTGDEQQAKNYLEQNCYIGVTGWVCDERRNQDLLDAIPLIPDERLMLETDAPFLLPRTLQPKPKNRRCEPKHLIEVGEAVAKLKNVERDFLAQQTTYNTVEFFDWALSNSTSKN